MVKVTNCTIQEFREKIKEKKIVCFGAGQSFIDFIETFSATEQIVCIVDNFRFGTHLEIDGYRVPIISMNELKGEWKNCIWTITTIKFADEIVKQLDAIDMCQNQEVYFPELLKIDAEEAICPLEEMDRIPKHIHYFWFGDNEMPDKFKRNIETWYKFCPDYEITCWNENNYDVTKNRYMYQAYKAEKWGFVPDYARLDVINTYGGIYLDTDVEVVKPLDNLLMYDMFCGFENAYNINFGQGFGAVVNHAILKEMMQQYEEIEFIKEDGTLNLTASPIYQTQVLERHGLVRGGQCQRYDNYMVFSPEYFSPINAYGIGQATEKTFSIHRYAATWYGSEERKSKERIINSYKFVMERMC